MIASWISGESVASDVIGATSLSEKPSRIVMVLLAMADAILGSQSFRSRDSWEGNTEPAGHDVLCASV